MLFILAVWPPHRLWLLLLSDNAKDGGTDLLLLAWQKQAKIEAERECVSLGEGVCVERNEAARCQTQRCPPVPLVRHRPSSLPFSPSSPSSSPLLLPFDTHPLPSLLLGPPLRTSRPRASFLCLAHLPFDYTPLFFPGSPGSYLTLVVPSIPNKNKNNDLVSTTSCSIPSCLHGYHIHSCRRRTLLGSIRSDLTNLTTSRPRNQLYARESVYQSATHISLTEQQWL